MYAAEYYIYFFSSFYLGIYIFAAIILLIGAIFSKNEFKTESYNLLYVFNTLAAWCSPLGLGFNLIELFIAWYGQNPYEWYAFRTGGSSTNVSWPWLLIKICLPLFWGLLLFFRRLRINRLYTLCFLILLNTGLIEQLIYRFTRDYLPSSWSTYYYEPYSEKIIKYSVILFFLAIIYFIAKKKNKLPYPSLFLK